MKKKNTYAADMSFDEFEQVMATGRNSKAPLEELIKQQMEQEKESRKKETELKRAKRLKK